ncbi:MAG: RluA family pseudouridine synthase [Caldilineaceae bacterium]
MSSQALLDQPITLTIKPEDAGQRLDRWLATLLPEHSRSEIQRWIKEGLVMVDSVAAKASHKVEEGQVVEVRLPVQNAETALEAEDIPVTIVYEDDDLLVIDKPAGLVVHPAPGHAGGTLVNAVLHHCPAIEGVGGERRPGIVHRLDKETSGLIVVAKNDRAHRDLQAQFKARTVGKEYIALVEGHVEPPQARISAPIGRHPTDRLRQAILPADKGRTAVTDYRVLGYYNTPVRDSNPTASFTLVSITLHTGRTHQIRVHFAWRKHPVVGDSLYGSRKQRLLLERHFLHAHRLRFRLPSTGEEKEFVAPLPLDLQRLLDTLIG